MSKATLEHADARVERAVEHLAELRSEVARVVGELRIGGFATGLFTETAASTRVGILVGETVYNLRAALDYLVYELARLRTERPLRTQFPLYDTRKQWEKERDKPFRLKGLADAHKDRIEAYQPFQCRWTSDLRDLSNPDKHETIKMAFSGVRLTVNTSDSMRRAGDMEDNSWVALLEDQRDVIALLEELCNSVRAVIEEFRGEFPA